MREILSGSGWCCDTFSCHFNSSWANLITFQIIWSNILEYKKRKDSSILRLWEYLSIIVVGADQQAYVLLHSATNSKSERRRAMKLRLVGMLKHALPHRFSFLWRPKNNTRVWTTNMRPFIELSTTLIWADLFLCAFFKTIQIDEGKLEPISVFIPRMLDGMRCFWWGSVWLFDCRSYTRTSIKPLSPHQRVCNPQIP